MEKRIERARKAVQERVGQHRQIAKDIGVSYPWLRKFADDKLKEPGAAKFDRLERWLEKH